MWRTCLVLENAIERTSRQRARNGFAPVTSRRIPTRRAASARKLSCLAQEQVADLGLADTGRILQHRVEKRAANRPVSWISRSGPPRSRSAAPATGDRRCAGAARSAAGCSRWQSRPGRRSSRRVRSPCGLKGCTTLRCKSSAPMGEPARSSGTPIMVRVLPDRDRRATSGSESAWPSIR